jgi:CheY-like chemotaxis protein
MHYSGTSAATVGEAKLSELAGKRILVVEDEAIIAEMVSDMLLDLGACVIGPAFSMRKAVELAELGEIDGAVLDVNIRSERVDAVAAILRGRTVPIVFATGNGDMIADLAGGAPVLEKPYTQEKLGVALSWALAAR